MLAGNAATAACFQEGPSLDSLLPSDVDGSTPPPSGAPNYRGVCIYAALEAARKPSNPAT